MNNDFDFLIGTWDVRNRRLVGRLTGSDQWEEFPGRSTCSRHFDGAANVDEIVFPTMGFSGLTVRIFDPATELWSIYWANSARGVLGLPPVVGRFEGDRGEFHADDEHEGTPVRCRFVWLVQGPDSCRWEQAFSADGEQTWETNWTMDLTRA
ncbi:hypothetical protein GCM10010149_65860 [Nonomuraea roseoviolacea subsp. roseoviolacea]|uniref:DUF1579 domain-containing protein n=1 Tax=Nonomuraea roseoviolacea subsp. carminata TaxID=160689 RepID=A0ABT1K684_9ACTN|nr:hypothetical protein [Nonomuraea roseoviolacea]MCP2349517.1 hypothetical protein [Nonomuraea roseoviolacea subsp. carminata]